MVKKLLLFCPVLLSLLFPANASGKPVDSGAMRAVAASKETGPANVASPSASVTPFQAAATPILNYNATNTYSLGTAISTLAPTNTGGAVAGLAYGTGTAFTGGSLNAPRGIAIGTAGNVYVAEQNLDNILKYTNGVYQGIAVPASAFPFSGPIAALAVDNAGNFYVGTQSNEIYKFSAAGVYISTLATSGGITAMYIDASNNLYFAEMGPSGVYEYSSSGVLLNSIALSLPPGGIAADASGNIYIENQVNQEVVKLAPNGTQLGVLASDVAAFSIYIDDSGNIYLGDSLNGKIEVYTPGGTLLASINNAGTSILSVVADAAGNVYVAQNGPGTAAEYSPLGGYYLTGTLPPGLSFDSTTGDITGTPTSAYSGTYTVTAYNAAGKDVSNTFVINVFATPTIAYTGSPFVYAEGNAITTLTPTVTGSPTSYSISPNLTANTGLTFDTTTGIISGTPTILSAAVTYTITAINGGPADGTTTISIAVAQLPVLAYNTPDTYSTGTTIPTLSPTNTGGAVASLVYGTGTAFTGGALVQPWGMAFDAAGNVYVANYGSDNVLKYTNGVYQGIAVANTAFPVQFNPTAVAIDNAGDIYAAQQNGSIYEFNSGGVYIATIVASGSTIYGLWIDAANNIYAAATNGSVYKYNNTGTLLLTVATGGSLYGVAVDNSGNIYALNTAGNQVLKYNAAGTSLGAIVTGLGNSNGLYVDNAGNIYVGDIGYNEVSAYNSTGALLANINGFSSPRGILADAVGNVYVSDYTNATIAEYPPHGGYYINGALPPGLTFNTSTGAITGTPTSAYSGTYTVTGYNAAGKDVSNTFTINVFTTPTIAYTGSPYTFALGNAITTLTPTVTGAPTSYSISPNLTANTGLTFDTTTGIISGTPTMLSAPVTYTITASNAGPATGSTTISIATEHLPNLAYNTPNTYSTGTAISTLSPTNTGGGVASLVYGTGTAFTGGAMVQPWGMAFDAAGNVYVANYGSDNVLKYTNGVYQGIAVANTAFPVQFNPTAVAIDNAGDIYVAQQNGSIYEFNSGGVYIATIVASGSTIYGLWIDAANNIYAAATNGSVYKYNNTGTLLLTVATGGSLYGVAVDNSGNIYALNTAGNQVLKYNAAGTSLGAIVTGLGNSNGLYVDNAGNIYVGDIGYNEVSAYNSTGALLANINGFSSPRGILADAAGNVYVSDYTNATITEYPPHGGYYINGALPPGLTFNTSTGAITGTPTAVYSGNYTVTGYDAAGEDVSNTFTINVSAPTIAYTGSPFTFAISNAIAALTPTVTGAPTSYSISPNSTTNTGLTFNTTNGIISGTPTILSPAVTYTITANNGGPIADTTTISIAVAQLPALAYTTPNTYSTGTAIPTLAPTNTGGAVASLVYGPGTQFTGGSLANPRGIALDAAGNVYVANYGSLNILKYTNDVYQGIAVQTSAFPAPAQVAALAVDNEGNFYAASTAIYKFNAAGTYLSSIPITGSVQAMYIDASNNLYVSSRSPGISEYNSAGVLLNSIALSGVPGGIAADASGNIYIETQSNLEVVKLAPNGTQLGVLASHVDAFSIYIDDSGNIYLGDSLNGKIEVYNPGGTLLASINNAGTSVLSVVADAAGNVYVAQYGPSTAAEYSPLGGYYLTGTLPPGLSFDSTTGDITGTPTSAYSGTYTVTAYNAAGKDVSNTFTINVFTTPTIAYTGSPYTFALGNAITTLTPTVTGAPTSYSISPNLTANTGLTFDTTTGIISGTPTMLSAPVTYTITASNAGPATGSTTISIATEHLPNLAYNTPNTYSTGTAIPTLSPTNTGGAVASLVYGTGTAFTGGAMVQPWGMAFDAAGNVYVANYGSDNVLKYTNGVYQGIAVANTAFPVQFNPTAVAIDNAGDIYVAQQNGSIYEFNSGGVYIATIVASGSTIYGLWIDAANNIYAAATNGSVYKYNNTGTLLLTVATGGSLYGVAVDNSGNIYALNTAGNQVLKYNAAGTSLGAIVTGLGNSNGLYVDNAGNIYVGDIGYNEVSAYNSTGALLANINGFSSPRGILADAAGNVYVSDYTNATITEYPPHGGYYINGALPPGLTFNTSTGAITGTPTAVYSGNYTVTGYDAAGEDVSNTFTITVSAPTIAYTGSPYTFAVGNGIATLTPTVTGSPTSYSISPNLTTNTGLTFNTTTGIISGTPTIISAAVTYTITAGNGGPVTGTTTISIAVAQLPSLAYTTPNTYSTGTAIPTLAPTNTGGAVASLVYGPGTQFTGGSLNDPQAMAFDAAGNVYVVNLGGNDILKYTNGVYQGVAVQTSAFPNPGYIGALAVDNAGNFYVAVANTGTIDKFNAAGVYISAISVSAVVTAIYTDASNDLYIDDGEIYEYSSAGVLLNTISLNLSSHALAVDASGNIYEQDANNLAVVEYSPNGTKLKTLESGVSNRTYLYIDNSGNIYVSDIVQNDVFVYNAAGTLLTTLNVSPEISSVLADAAGNLYLSEPGLGNVVEYPPLGGYYLTGALPPGLSFDSTTGDITGTPTAAYSGTYTVTAYNAAGKDVSNTFTINVVTTPPTIAYTGSPYTFALGNAITTLTPTVTGAPTSYSISPNLTANTGLTFDTTTGIISGIPTIVSAAVTYTITASNAGPATGSTTISIATEQLPSLAYTTPNTYSTGTAIPTLSPTNTGGAVASLAYGAGTQFTGGSLNTPRGIAIGTAGNVYVAEQNLDNILKYTNGVYQGIAVPASAFPALRPVVALAVDNAGNFYVATQSNQIYKFNAAGAYIATITTAGQVTTMYVNASNNIYVGCSGPSGVYEYSNTGVLLNSFSTDVHPNAIAADASGNIYEQDGYHTAVVEYAPNGTQLNILVSFVTNNSYLYIDNSGNIYLGNNNFGTLSVYNPGGALLASINVAMTISGVLADAAGNIYVSQAATNTVTEYPPLGGYYLTGALPPGLSFDSTTGNITGTPTSAYSGTYTVTAYNAAGADVSNTFVINVFTTPTIAYTGSPYTFALGNAITTLTPTVTGAPTSYSISPNLTANTGLTFDTTTGIISGTPTMLSAPVTYTITAINGGPADGTTTISIATEHLPNLAYNTPNTYSTGTAIPTLSPTNTGGAVASLVYGTGTAFTGGTLVQPWGMAFDAAGNVYVANYGSDNVLKYTNGVYQGIAVANTAFPVQFNPTAVAIDNAGDIYVAQQNGSIYEFNSGGVYIATIVASGPSIYGLWIDAANNIYAAATDGSVYKYNNTGTLLLTVATGGSLYGVAVDNSGNIYALNTAGNQVLKYNAAGTSLGAIVTGLGNSNGLYVDNAGNIYVGDIGYNEVSAYNSTGALLANINGFSSPRGILADAAGNVYVSDYTNATITEYPPHGGYYINGALPPGLTFNTSTGAITGTPTAVYSGTYIVTAYDAAGEDVSNTFTINCVLTPTIAYTGSPYTFAVGNGIATLIPTVTGSPTSYSISPNLTTNTGLTFNTTNGIISGTPTILSGAVTYTITANNGGPATGSTTISIAVAELPSLAYTTPNTYSTGTAISTLSPTNTGGAVASLAYGPGTLFTGGAMTYPNGIAFDAAGNVYVANSGDNNILKYTNGAYQGIAVQASAIPNPAFFDALAVDNAGNIYVALNGGKIYKFNAGGTYISTISLPSTVTAIYTDASNNLYVAESGTPEIFEYSSAGVLLNSIALPGAPGGIAVDVSGNIYVAEPNSNEVVELAPNGTQLRVLASGVNVSTIYIDNSGNIYLGDNGSGTLSVYNPGGALLANINVSPTISGVLADAAGNIYASVSGPSTVTEYPPLGGYYLTGALPPGLSFDSTTGNITGTPTAAYSGTYTVTAYNAAGKDVSNTFTINIVTTPTIAYTGSPFVYAEGNGIATLIPTVTGSPTSYSISPNLTTNTGLTFNTTNGIISGTPTILSGAVTYTITANNAGPITGSTTISIATEQLPNLVYTTPNTYSLNAAIPTLAPTDTGGAVAGLVYGPGTAFTGGAMVQPWGMAFDAVGNVYVTNYGSGNVLKYTNGVYQGIAVANTAFPVQFNPTGIAINSAGDIYVAQQNGSVYEFNSGGVYMATVVASGSTVYALWIDAANNIYLAAVNGDVYKYSSTGALLLTVTTGGALFGVAVDNSGNIYALNTAGNEVLKYNAAGTLIGTIISGLGNSNGLYVDNAGNIYIGDTGLHDVSVYNSGGTLLTNITGLTNPQSVLADPAGNVYVCDYTNAAVTEYPPHGGYFISGPLPPGLTFNSSTGIIAGTPTATYSGSYTVTGYDAAGKDVSNTFTINCINPPTVVYTGSPFTFALGTAIATLTPAVTGSPTTFTIGPSLTANTGLTFNTGTGVISGIPTVGSAAVTYTIIANNGGNSADTTTISIATEQLPNLVYTTPNTYSLNAAIPTLAPTNTGGAVASLVYGPGTQFTGGSLTNPYGMAFDAAGNIYVAENQVGNILKYTNGVYQGIAVQASAFPVAGYPQAVAVDNAGNIYVGEQNGGLYEFNAAGAYIGQLAQVRSITGIWIDASNNIYIVALDTLYKYSSSGTLLLSMPLVGAPVQSVAVDGSGNIYVSSQQRHQVLEYNAAGTLLSNVLPSAGDPTSLYIDDSGNIYVGSSTPGNVSEYNPGGTLLASINTSANIYGLVVDAAGNVYASDVSANTITEYPPLGGYYLTGALPPGLSFDSTTGNITGTPTAAYSGTYTVTGYNAAGKDVSNTFTINVVTTPTIAYTGSPFVYAEGNAITTLTPTVTGSPSSYSISPNLTTNTGLTFNTTNGIISGTPTILSGAVTYTITANNGGPATGSTTITIAVAELPNLVYTTPNTYSLNAAIPTLAPTNTGGAVAGLVYGPGTAFTGGSLAYPYGMAFDAAGNVYVAEQQLDNVLKYTNGVYQGIAVQGSAFPASGYVISLVVDNAGNFYVGLQTGIIYKFNAAGAYVSTITTPSSSLTGMAVDASNNIYVACFDPFRIYKYSSAGVLLATITTPGPPAAIALDASGNIYEADMNYQAILELSPTGTLLNIPIQGLSNPVAMYIDNSGNIYVGDNGPGTVSVYNPAGTLLTSIHVSPGITGVLEDAAGNIYESQASTSTVTEYPPLGGYYLTGTLPPGLSFDNTTGDITGTPTATYSGTYTVTAYNSAGKDVSNTFTINCSNTYDWTGAISTDWNTPGNWATNAVPGATNTASIGVNIAFTNQPDVGSAGANAIGGLQIGNSGGRAVTLTATSPYTLVITGDIIKQSDANSGLGYVATLTGSGTITADELTITANTALATPASYTETITSSVTTLQLAGDLSLTSSADGNGNALNAQFNLTGGVTTLGTTGLLTTDNAANSKSAFNLTGGTLQVSALTFLSELASTGTNVITLGTGSVLAYAGAAQVVYTDAPIANLSGGTGLSYGGIAFSGTGIKSPVATGNLNVSGNFTNTMPNDATDYVALTANPVFFNGNGPQSLAGGSGNGTVFTNVTFNGGGQAGITGGMFYVTSAGVLTMAGNSSLAAGGYLTLNSDATGSASVAQVPAGCSITGTVNVQRYISGERGYRLLSSPVYAGAQNGNYIYSINYLVNNTNLDNNLYLTGPAFTVTGTTGVGNPTVYLYDEGFVPQYTTFYNSNFIAVSSLNGGTGTDPAYTMYSPNGATTPAVGGVYNIPVGNGYYAFYRGNMSEGLANLTNPAYSPIVPATVVASGTLTQGQVTFADWYTPTSTDLGGISQNYNLIGNPYASAIDLNSIQGTLTNSGIYITPYNGATGVAKFIYELNPFSGSYGLYTYDGSAPATNGAGEFIASGEGFFVQAYGAPSKLIFNENAKATSTDADAPGLMAKRVSNFDPVRTNPLLLMKMSADSINTDETILSFNPNSSSKYAFNEDAPHRAGVGIVGMSSMSSDNIKMAINTMPLQSSMVIPLNVNATVTGLYNIALTQLAPLPSIYEMWLKDAYKKDSLDIKDNPTYNFDINITDTATYGSNRFSLEIVENPALVMHLLSFNATKVITGVNVLWTTENEQNYTNFTVERSTDGGKTFADLGSLTSSAAGNYKFLDKDPVTGANLYRLKIIEVDGSIVYSNVVTIMYANTGNTITINGGMMVYPNPTAGVINLSITQTTSSNGSATATPTLAGASYKIEIVNNLGVILKTAISSSPNWQADVTALMPGTYFISVVNAADNTVVGKAAFVKL